MSILRVDGNTSSERQASAAWLFRDREIWPNFTDPKFRIHWSDISKTPWHIENLSRPEVNPPSCDIGFNPLFLWINQLGKGVPAESRTDSPTASQQAAVRLSDSSDSGREEVESKDDDFKPSRA